MGGEIENRGAFGGAHPLDLLVEVQAADRQVDMPPVLAGSAGMICNRFVEMWAVSRRQNGV